MAGLTFEDGSYFIDGEKATERRVIAWRNDQVETWADEFGDLAARYFPDGGPSEAAEFPIGRVTGFFDRLGERVGAITVSAYVTAAGGTQRMTRNAWEAVAGLVKKQNDYLAGFRDDVRSGKLSAAQIAARARRYAPSAVEAFERGRAVLRDFDAPEFPGERCEGQTNCRCWWEIGSDDKGVYGIWHTVSDGDTCSICSGNAGRYNPFRR